jgi:hypothetical protein
VRVARTRCLSSRRKLQAKRKAALRSLKGCAFAKRRMATHCNLILTIALSEGSKVPDRLSSPDSYHNTNEGS